MSKRYYVLILLSLGLLTRFMFFGHPNETVFDEVHFGKFVSGYYTREYFFDIHPPLGKLAIAGFAKLFDFKPEFAFAEIGDPYPDNQYKILRFLPSLAGALLPLIIFLLLLEMRMGKNVALMGGLFIVLENALITQSRYILLDTFLLLFGFTSLLFYFKFRNKSTPHNTYHIILFGVFAGLAISVKWTGLGFLGLPLLIELIRIVKNLDYRGLMKVIILPFSIAILIYFSFFTVHLNILNKSGSGDAFMSPGFQKTLHENKSGEDESINSSNLLQKFTELNFEMYKANQRLTAEHPYSSQWYTWPFMARTIYYWVGSNSSPQVTSDSRIYLIGNPILWWLSTLAILVIISRFIANLKIEIKNFTSVFILSGFIVNILPFVGVKRVMFLYHYFTAYIFAIIMLVWLLSKWLDPARSKQKTAIIMAILLGLSTASFLYFSPLTYGLELKPEAYESRVWLDSWR